MPSGYVVRDANGQATPATTTPKRGKRRCSAATRRGRIAVNVARLGHSGSVLYISFPELTCMLQRYPDPDRGHCWALYDTTLLSLANAPRRMKFGTQFATPRRVAIALEQLRWAY